MNNKKNKFWTLVFGAILANSYLWLIDLGRAAPVPQWLQTDAAFVHQYYPVVVIIVLSALVTTAILLMLTQVLDIRVSDYMWWLFWPSLGFVVFTAVAAQALLVELLTAVFPAFIIFSIAYTLEKRKNINRLIFS